jgi:hypothetical protein
VYVPEHPVGSSHLTAPADRAGTAKAQLTVIVPVMKLWILQWMLNVPALDSVIVLDPLENTPVSNDPSVAVSE